MGISNSNLIDLQNKLYSSNRQGSNTDSNVCHTWRPQSANNLSLGILLAFVWQTTVEYTGWAKQPDHFISLSPLYMVTYKANFSMEYLNTVTFKTPLSHQIKNWTFHVWTTFLLSQREFNPFSSDRQHLSYDGCLEVRGKRGDYQNCSESCIVYWSCAES